MRVTVTDPAKTVKKRKHMVYARRLCTGGVAIVGVICQFECSEPLISIAGEAKRKWRKEVEEIGEIGICQDARKENFS